MTESRERTEASTLQGTETSSTSSTPSDTHASALLKSSSMPHAKGRVCRCSIRSEYQNSTGPDSLLHRSSGEGLNPKHHVVSGV